MHEGTLIQNVVIDSDFNNYLIVQICFVYTFMDLENET